MADVTPPAVDSETPETPTVGGKRSAWMAHVKKTMRANPSKKLGQVLKMASKTFKKAKKGGAAHVAATAAAVGGRRKTRKSKKGGRKH